MRLARYILIISFIFFYFFPVSLGAETEVRKIATWNMKWLGTSSGNQLDAVENVADYVDVIIGTGATLFALQEIGATHSEEGIAKCYYLDLIIRELKARQNINWRYILDNVNKNQRLAFLYREDKWKLTYTESIKPGKSFYSIRKPFVAFVSGVHNDFYFYFINIHFKAFSSATKKRIANTKELTKWIVDYLDSKSTSSKLIIAGDTNYYPTESDIENIFRKGYMTPIYDDENTVIYKQRSDVRFDRFYASLGLLGAIYESSPSEDLVDVIKKDNQNYISWFEKTISDHFPVVMNIIVDK